MNQQCPCVKGHTRLVAQQELGVNPLVIYRKVREQVLRWYDVEYLDELDKFYPDVRVALHKFWRVLNYPVNEKMAALGDIPNPDCWLCSGSGIIDQKRWMEAEIE